MRRRGVDLYSRLRGEMRISSRVLRITSLSVVVGAMVYGLVTDAFADRTPATRVGDAGVALGDDTARSVEPR